MQLARLRLAADHPKPLGIRGSRYEMRVLCTLVMLASLLPVLFVLFMTAVQFHKPQYDSLLIVGSVFFSGGLIGRCILEGRPQPGADA